MHYPDGEKVLLGDRVSLWEGCQGVVVASMDDEDFGADYPAQEWAYLKRGVLIDSDAAGLIHFLEQEADFRLIERGA